MEQLAITNRPRMEHITFSVINLGSKYPAIVRAHSNNTIMHTNQASAFIDRQVHGDGEIYFGSQKSCKNISIDFGRNTNDSIYANLSITIGSISPQITIMKSCTGIGFGRNSGDGIPQITPVYLASLAEGISLLSTGSLCSMEQRKAKVKILKAIVFSKTLGAGIILKLKTLGTKIL